ncbi:MAG: hypothetical protein COB04_16230 [Gammaproteobacteria bacterium]|nr:MAG: hypothetical protein COB04_16230 [Gammaproteobacteria bacterium]
MRQFVEPALPFDSYDIELSLIDLSVQADQFASRNLIVGTALEVYMDSPGNTNSVVYDSGTRFENAEVRRAALMSYIVAAGSVYTERTVADGTLLTRVKPTLKLRVRPEGLVLDIRVVLKPQMGHNPGTPNWADGVEVGPMLLALNAHVVGRFVAPAYA